MIYPDQRLSLDHTPFTVNIAINKELIHIKKYTIVKNSEEENKFITELIESIKKLNTENISSKKVLEQVVQEFTNKMNSIWFKKYRLLKRLKDWKNFKSTIKRTKHMFFDIKIQEITSRSHGPQKLIN